MQFLFTFCIMLQRKARSFNALALLCYVLQQCCSLLIICQEIVAHCLDQRLLLRRAFDFTQPR